MIHNRYKRSFYFIICVFMIICQIKQNLYAKGGDDSASFKRFSQELNVNEKNQALSLAESIEKEQEDLQKSIENASPFVSEFLMKLACGNAGSAIISHLDINTPSSKIIPPMTGMRGHLMGCLKIDRIYDWQLMDSNVLKFTVVFRSLISNETNRYTYITSKQKNGQWLFGV